MTGLRQQYVHRQETIDDKTVPLPEQKVKDTEWQNTFQLHDYPEHIKKQQLACNNMTFN